MIVPPIVLPESALADRRWMAERLQAAPVRYLPVLDSQKRPVGIVTPESLQAALGHLWMQAMATSSQVSSPTVPSAMPVPTSEALVEQVKARTIALQDKTKWEKLLLDLATRLRLSPSLQMILDVTLEQVQRGIGCDRVSLLRFGPTGDSCVIAEATTVAPSLMGQRLEAACFEADRQLYHLGHLRIVPNVQTTQLSPRCRAMLNRLGMQATILVPLLWGNKLWGLLSVAESHHARDWQPEEVELLQTLSLQLAIAIQQAITNEQLQIQLHEKQQAEARLQESQQRYRSLAEAVPVGIFRTNTAGDCIYVNDRWIQMIGQPLADLLGQGWQDTLHPDDRAWVVAAWHQAVQAQQPFRAEYRFQHTDGRVIWVYGQTVAERDAEGQIVGYVGTVTDISDRKQAEATLQESEARTRALLATIPDYLFCLGANGTYREIITQRDINLWPRDLDPIGSAMCDVIPAEIATRQAALEAALQTGELQTYEQAIALGKEVRYEEVRVMKSGEDEALFMVRDITQRKQAIAALRHSEQTNRAIIAALPDLLMQMNCQGQLKHVLASNAQPLLYPLELAESPTIYSFLPPEQAEQRLACARQAIASNRLQILEQVVESNGESRCEEIRMTPLNETEVLVIVRDISDRKRAETALHNLIEGTAATTGQAFFPALVRHIAEALEMAYVFVTERQGETLQPLAIWANGTLQSPWTYDLEQTPCQLTFEQGIFYCEQGVQQQFPDDPYLVEMAAESYFGMVLQGTDGQVIGHLCILDTTPFKDLKQAEQLLRVFAARAAAELERQRAIAALEQLNEILEAQVKSRTAALKMGAARHQALVEIIPDLMIRIHADGTYLDVVTGDGVELFNPGQAKPGVNIYDVTPLEHAQERMFYVHQALQTRQVQFYEYDLVINDQLCTEEARIVAINHEEALVIVRDITDRKRAEKALKESKQFIRTVIDTVPLPLFWKDVNSTFLGCNQQFATVLGLPTTSELVGKTDFDLPFAAEVARAYQADDRQVMTSRQAQLGIEETTTLPNGQQRWLETHKAPITDWAGEVVGVVGMFQDVTDRKLAELRLQASEEKFRSLVENANDIIYSLTADGVFTYVSPNWTEILGHDLQELINRPFMPLVHPDDLPGCLAFLRAVVSNGQKKRGIEYRVQHKNGEWRWHTSNASPNRDKAGNVIGYLGIARDITTRKQAEAELQRTNAELVRATRLKDEFLATMSHELRTPLNAILGMTEGLREHVFGEVNPRQSKALQTIERSGSHLLALINDILDVAKIESGQMEFQCAPTSVELLCKSSLAFIKQQAFKKQIQIETVLPPNLPDLVVDELRIRQVLINLLSNAVKFTPEGGRIRVEVSLLPPQAEAESPALLRMAIADTGIGIAPENMNKLFQPFVQIDSALNRQYQGTGLGLCLVKRIVEHHGGQVSLTSEVGVGSCFMIDLPCVAVASDTPIAPALDADTAPSSSGMMTSPLILLAEDNEANILTVTGYLRAHGCRLIVAKNGQEAIDLAQSARPDLILMDIQMPIVDGLEAIRRIRQDLALATPIIALTALTMAGDRDRCLAAGANDYLSKPLKMRELVTKIYTLLQELT